MPLNKLAQANVLAALKAGDEANETGLKGKQAQEQSKLEAFLKGEAQKRELQLAEESFEKNKGRGGGSVKVGDTTIGSKEFNPMGMATKGADAVKHAYDMYSKGLKPVQDKFTASTEGLDAINDAKNPGSLGQARTLMLKAMGMNRYNEQEAKAVLPPSLHSMVSGLFNQAGDDNNPLNEPQRTAINQFFQSQLKAAKQQHDMLKQTALGSYQSSPFFDPGRHEQLKATMGQPFEQAFSEASKRYSQVPQTQGPQLTQQPLPGPLDKLKAFFHMGGQQQAPQSGLMRVKHTKTGQVGTIDPNNPQDQANLKAGIFQPLGQ